MTNSPATAELLVQLRFAVNADHRRRARRRRTAAIALVSTLAVTGVAVAAATQAPWWKTGSPAIDPHAVVSVARDNLPARVDPARARTVARTHDAALVAVPIDTTGYCLIPTLSGRANLGAQCEYQVANPKRGDDDRFESVARPASATAAAAWIVYGRITDPRATAVDLGALTVRLGNGGFFLATLPRSDWVMLGGTANTGTILDSSGATLRTGCVNWGPAPTRGHANTDTDIWTNGTGPCKPQGPPARPTIDFQRASKLFEVKLKDNFSIWKATTTIAFWSAPADDGSQCVIPGSTTAPNRFGGSDCANPARHWATGETFDPVLGAQRIHSNGTSGYAWMSDGRVNPARGVAKVELRTASGTTRAAFAHGYFFVQLPGTSLTTRSLPGAGPATLIAVNSSGAQIGSYDLSKLHARASPH